MLFSIFPLRTGWEFLCGFVVQSLLLRLDECGQAASSAFAKLAISQFIGESFKVRHSVNRKVFKLRIGRVQVQRGLTQEAAAYRLAQLEMVDAKQLQRFLNLGEQTAFKLDSLRGDSVVHSPALGKEDEENESAGDDEKQTYIRDVRIGPFDVSSLHRIPDSCRDSDHDKKGRELADRINEGRMADKKIVLCLVLLGSSELGEVRVAESALDCDGLDGLSAKRAGFAVWIHGSLLSREDINPSKDTNAR
jgi:hypothetical protein